MNNSKHLRLRNEENLRTIRFKENVLFLLIKKSVLLYFSNNKQKLLLKVTGKLHPAFPKFS